MVCNASQTIFCPDSAFGRIGVCLSVYIRQPIEPNFFVGPRQAPGKLYG